MYELESVSTSCLQGVRTIISHPSNPLGERSTPPRNGRYQRLEEIQCHWDSILAVNVGGRPGNTTDLLPRDRL